MNPDPLQLPETGGAPVRRWSSYSQAKGDWRLDPEGQWVIWTDVRLLLDALKRVQAKLRDARVVPGTRAPETGEPNPRPRPLVGPSLDRHGWPLISARSRESGRHRPTGLLRGPPRYATMMLLGLAANLIPLSATPAVLVPRRASLRLED